MSKDGSKYKAQSRLIHGKFNSSKWDFRNHIVPPISSSTAFRLESVERGAKGFTDFANPDIDRDLENPIYIYERLDEPMKGMLEENLAAVEGGETAVTFATGMAAISSALGATLKTGDKLIAHNTLYGCTYSLISNWYPRYNIECDMIDLTKADNLKKAFSPNARVVYFETPCNPTLAIIDIKAVCDLVKEENSKRKEDEKILVIVDDTFSTPFCQRPLEFGADFVIHSLTKGIGGFGTDTGGAIICPKKWESKIMLYRKDFGGVMAAKTAWPFLAYGLPTLTIRIGHQIKAAKKVAEFLSKHPKVESVRYPGLESHPQHEIAKKQMLDFEGNFAPGTLVYFNLKGDDKQAFEDGKKLMNWIAKNSFCFTLAVSLGWVKTLIEHPSSMTHSMIPVKEQAKAGMNTGGIRISVGLENVDDIIGDLKEGLDKL